MDTDNPYQATGPVDGAPPARTRRHTPCGPWSLAVGVLGAICLIGGMVLAAVAAKSGGQTPSQADMPLMMAIGLLIIFGLGLALVGSVLGVIGITDRQRRRITAIIGLVLSGGMLLVVGALMVIGLVVKA